MVPTNGKFDLCVIENFFDQPTCRRLINEICQARSVAALTFGRDESGEVDQRARKVRSAQLNAQTVNHVKSVLVDHLPRLREHFDIPVCTVEEPQFLWYRTGDFFVAHQDGNTKMIQLESDRLRRISLSVFLNEEGEGKPAGYTGGSLIFTDLLTGDRCLVRGETGKLVAFRSELTHEVKPVKHGERFAVVTWCRIVG